MKRSIQSKAQSALTLAFLLFTQRFKKQPAKEITLMRHTSWTRYTVLYETVVKDARMLAAAYRFCSA